MRRAFALLLALALVLATAGCGGVILGINGNFSTISGFVSVVQITVISNGDGTTTTVTVVTLLSGGIGSTQNFCGNVATQFPLNTTVTATFNPGAVCGTIISVVIRG